MKAARIVTIEDFKQQAPGGLALEQHGAWRACSVHGDFEIYTFPISNPDLHVISVWHPENIADPERRARSMKFKQDLQGEIGEALAAIPVGVTHMGFMPSQFDPSIGSPA